MSVQLFIIILLVLVIFICTIVYTLKYKNAATAALTVTPLSKIPQVPPSVPLLGSLEYFGGPYDFLKLNTTKYGDIFTFSLLGQEVVFVGTTQEARDLFFKSEPETLHFYEGYKELFGAIIGRDLFSDHNKEIGMLLNQTALKRYFVDVIENTHNHLEQLWGKDGEIDLFHTAYKIVFKMTLRIMGCREVANDHFEAFSKCYHILDSEFSSLSLFMPWFPNSTQIKRYFARKTIFKLLDDIIEKRIQTPNYADDNISKIVDYYRKEDGFVDKEHIKYFCMATMFAAQTNTALSAAWTLLYLISHPDHWETAVKEVKAAVSKHDGKITFDVLEEMKFVDKCIDEALRLTISSGGWWRKVMYDLPFRDYTIPQGALMVNNPALYHLDEKYFKNAFQFDPYRSDENPNVAFGSGKHPCLGKKMAHYEVKTFIATVFTNYTITPPNERIPEVNRNTMHGSWPVKMPFIKVSKNLPLDVVVSGDKND